MHKRTCIIGAGSSGMVAAKVLLERGVSFDCFEMGSQIGGLWRYNNDNGLSAAYKSLHINSSKGEMAFSDFPMPAEYPDFPHHSQIIKYFDDYATHFGLRDHVQFRHAVESVVASDDGYKVTIRNAQGQRHQQQYESVIVANGHHWSPKTPEFSGEFAGRSLHSHDYRTPDAFADQRVLVIGIGNSGCDIACDISRVAAQTVLSTRRGAHIIPKYIFGKPLDRVCPPVLWHILPTAFLKQFFSACLYLARGRLRRYGLPTPPHKILEEHPTVSADLLNRIGHGQVKIKPNVESFAGREVHFVDETTAEFDSVIFATGYQIRFPFLDDQLLRSDENEVPLYRKVVHAERAGLYFVGLVQPWGPLMPLAEAQSEWVADLISDRAQLPPKPRMLSEIARERDVMRKRYTNSERHTIQVDFHPYLRQLKNERARGKKLAMQIAKLAPMAETETESQASSKERKAA